MFPIKNNNYIGIKKNRYVPLNIFMPNFVTILISASVNSDPNRLLSVIFPWSRKTVYLLMCSLTIFGSAGIWADNLCPSSQWKCWKCDIRSSVFNKYIYIYIIWQHACQSKTTYVIAKSYVDCCDCIFEKLFCMSPIFTILQHFQWSVEEMNNIGRCEKCINIINDWT